MDKHAVYAIAEPLRGAGMAERIAFRVGMPVDWARAQARWSRLDDRRIGHRMPARAVRVRYLRRWYVVQYLEVRATDRHGRGLGSARHERAMPVPYRMVRSAA